MDELNKYGLPGRQKFTEEEKKERARERERRRREVIRAQKIVDGTYRQPTQAQAKQLATLNADAKCEDPLPEHVRASLNKRELYLAYLEKGLRRTQAAERAGVKYSTVKYWRGTDDSFRARELDVEDTFLDNVEDVLRQLAQANDIRAITKILESRRPEVWAPKKEVHMEHTLQFAGSVEERLDRIARLMEAAKRPELEPVIWQGEVIEDAVIVPDPYELPSESGGS